MTLLTQELIDRLPPIRGQEERGMEAIAYARLFTPDSDWAWYITEFDGQDTLFGLVTGYERELGYFSPRWRRCAARWDCPSSATWPSRPRPCAS